MSPLSRFVASQSILWAIMAILFLILPVQFIGYFGPVLSPGAEVVARLFGAELTALAIVSFTETARRWPSNTRAVWFAYAASNTLGTIVCFLGIRAHALNERGWFLVAAYGLYAAVFLIAAVCNPGEPS
jgi:hypothetical protein